MIIKCRCLFISLLLLSAYAVPTKAQTPAEWALSVDFPSSPIARERELQSPAGPIKEEHLFVEKGSRVWACVKVTFPVPIPESNLASIYANGRDNMLKARHGELISDEEVEIAGRVGRKYIVKFGGGAKTADYRVVFIEQALFQIVYEAASDGYDSNEAKVFHDSARKKAKQSP